MSLNVPTGAGWIENWPLSRVVTGVITCSGTPVP